MQICTVPRGVYLPSLILLGNIPCVQNRPTSTSDRAWSDSPCHLKFEVFSTSSLYFRACDRFVGASYNECLNININNNNSSRNSRKEEHRSIPSTGIRQRQRNGLLTYPHSICCHGFHIFYRFVNMFSMFC